MSGASSPSGVPGAPRRNVQVWFIALIAVMMAIAFAFAAGGVFFRTTALESTLSRHVEFLGHGEAPLEIPIMTSYTAPKIPNATVTSHVLWSIESTRTGASTTYLLSWQSVSKTSLPIRFVFNASGPHPYVADLGIGSVENGFLLNPAGSCSTDCDSIKMTQEGMVPGIFDVTAVVFRMTYNVSRVTETRGSTTTSYIEVDYSLRAWCFCGMSGPAANVTLPRPQDLWSIGVDRLPAGSSVSLSVHGLSLPVDMFRNSAKTVQFSAGPEGILSAQLVSAYRWGPVDDYVLSFSASADASIHYFLDLRFGSILILYDPATA